MRILLIALLFLLVGLKADEEYQLGKGKQIGSLPLYIGGYFSLDYKHTDDTDRYRVDDIAVMGYGSYEKFSYMAEFEFKELYVETHENGVKRTTHDDKLYTERLYLDYNLNENYMFRAGKYNSPVGFWNMLPINVIRETTSSPMSTSILYPKFITGLGASYVSYGDSELKMDVMLQNNSDISADYNNYKTDRQYALGLTYENGEHAIKLNGGYFHTDYENVPQDDLYYLLLSYKYDTEKFQIMAEAGSQRSDNDYTTEYAAYLQGVYRFTEKHIGVIRAESYDDNANAVSDDMLIFGYTYRPLYPIAVKSEYQFHSKSGLNQFLFSFSVLF